jgi:LysM repeat protein
MSGVGCTTGCSIFGTVRTSPPNVQPEAFNVSGSNAPAVAATVMVSGTSGAPVEVITNTVPGTPTQDPYTNAIAYEVKSNDTMGEIANKFDVDLDILLSYNALSDADALSVGQVIYIPVTPQAPPTRVSGTDQITGCGRPRPNPAPVAQQCDRPGTWLRSASSSPVPVMVRFPWPAGGWKMRMGMNSSSRKSSCIKMGPSTSGRRPGRRQWSISIGVYPTRYGNPARR